MSVSELDSRIDALRAADAIPGSVLDVFRQFLVEAPEEQLFRMSPLRFAADRGVPEQLAIDLFLHATHRGILEFAWGILCPGCLAFLTTPGALRSFQKKHCGFCNIDVGSSIDDHVEVAFTVAPAVRKIRFHSPETLDLRRDALRLHFSSSLAPDSQPHQAFAKDLIHAGRALPGAAETFRIQIEHIQIALLAPASHAVLYLLREGGEGGEGAASSVSVELFDGGAIPAEVHVPAGPVSVTIHNRMSQPAGYVVGPVETSLWVENGQPIQHARSAYLTGPRLVASQVFRDLFRAESIPSEGGLELKSVTLLFTDLKGSTAIYERVGDLRAYDLVRRHFSALRDVAAAEGGAIVKTIGDAIMASFADPESAMRAAVRMSRAVEQVGEGELLLKIGAHTGPAIAVELNDRLDYFGRTVNIAARVQGIAGPGEIVCTEAVHESPGVAPLVARAGLAAERSAVPLRGIAGEVPIVRLRAG
jgi:class 3 adenylate cyclase